MSEANTDGDGLPEQPVVMRLTEGAVPPNPACYADLLPCPFCGAPAQQRYVDGFGIMTGCFNDDNCLAAPTVRSCQRKPGAKVWNTRAGQNDNTASDTKSDSAGVP